MEAEAVESAAVHAADWGLAGDVDDLIERFAGAGVGVRGHSFQRMRFRLSCAPVEGFGLVGEDVTCCTFRTRDLHGKRVGVVVGCTGHRHTNDDAGAFVEFARGEHKEGVDVSHLPSRLWIAVDPNHVASIGAPGLGLAGHLGYFVSNGFGRHRLAAVLGGIERGELLG
jgi:hypothetical protein